MDKVLSRNNTPWEVGPCGYSILGWFTLVVARTGWDILWHQPFPFLLRLAYSSWIVRARHQLIHGSRTIVKDSEQMSPTLSANCFLDDMQMLVPIPGDYPNWPSEETATQLLESYFRIVHASVPFLGELYPLRQFRSFYANPGAQSGTIWMAVLNLIFAVASRHSSLLREECGADVPYFTLAWALYTRARVYEGYVEGPCTPVSEIQDLDCQRFKYQEILEVCYQTWSLALRPRFLSE